MANRINSGSVGVRVANCKGELSLLPAPITARESVSRLLFMCGHGNDPDSPSRHTFIYNFQIDFDKKYCTTKNRQAGRLVSNFARKV